MKFYELAVGEKFTANGSEFTKIPEERISCCQIKWNAENNTSKDKVVMKPMDDVERVVVDNA